MFTEYLPKGFACIGCKSAAWKTVCEPCKENLLWNESLLASPVSELEAIAPLLFSYTRSQNLIRRFKERGGSDVQKALLQMRHPLKRKLMETHLFAIVPIPQDQDRSYRRGHESARTTARFFSQQLHLPVLPLLKLKAKNTQRLTGLRKFEREWAENPFCLTDDLKWQFSYGLFQEKINQKKEIRILLIDDLITSGSTLSKASDTLRELSPNLKIWGGSVGFRPHRRFH